MRLRPILLFPAAIAVAAYVLTGAAADSPREFLSDTGSKGEVRRWEVTGPWGGDVRAMVVSPDNADLLYLGTSDGQLYRSTDGAATWNRLKPGLDKRGVSVDNIAIGPRNTKLLYAGAWAVAQGNGEEGGVFKSEDGGVTWKLLKDTKGESVLSVALAPSDSNLVFAGARSGLFRSTDAGQSFQRISPENHVEIRNINSVAIDPFNPEVIYIGTHHLPWKTTDGGQTWKQTGYKETGMLDDSDIMGISVNQADSTLVYMNACSGIYRSNNAGGKWAKLPGIPFSARRTYALLPHPTQPNVIFAGTSEGLWRSKDGGKAWRIVTSKSVVIRSIVVHADRPNRVLIATDDFGVRVSEDLGDTFTDANTGFIHRHVLAIMPDLVERGRLLASVYHDGTAGGVFLSTDGGESWQLSSTGLGGRDVFALYQMPDDPKVIYAGTNHGVFRSNDRGSTWSFVGGETRAPVKKQSTKRTRRVVLVPARAAVRFEALPVIQRRPSRAAKRAPVQKKRPAKSADSGPLLITLTRQVDDITSFTDNEGRSGLMASTIDGLFRTFDENKGWERVAITGYDQDSRVFSVATHREMPNKILVGTRQGLFVSYDGGVVWEHVGRGPSDMSVKSIAISARDPYVILVGTNQYVFRTTNGGRTWTRRGGGLPGGDFTSVVINPDNPSEMLVAEYARGGVYRSTDTGYSWERIDRGELPSNRVWTVAFDPFDGRRAYAGSFSSGVYVLTMQQTAFDGARP